MFGIEEWAFARRRMDNMASKKMAYRQFWKEHDCEYCLHFTGLRHGCSLEEENCILDEKEIRDIRENNGIPLRGSLGIGKLMPSYADRDYILMMSKLNSTL